MKSLLLVIVLGLATNLCFSQSFWIRNNTPITLNVGAHHAPFDGTCDPGGGTFGTTLDPYTHQYFPMPIGNEVHKVGYSEVGIGVPFKWESGSSPCWFDSVCETGGLGTFTFGVGCDGYSINP